MNDLFREEQGVNAPMPNAADALPPVSVMLVSEKANSQGGLPYFYLPLKFRSLHGPRALVNGYATGARDTQHLRISIIREKRR
jgi:hypothetical protein